MICRLVSIANYVLLSESVSRHRGNRMGVPARGDEAGADAQAGDGNQCRHAADRLSWTAAPSSAFRHGSPTLSAPCGRFEAENDGLPLPRQTHERPYRQRERERPASSPTLKIAGTLLPSSSSASKGAKRLASVGDPFRNGDDRHSGAEQPSSDSPISTGSRRSAYPPAHPRHRPGWRCFHWRRAAISRAWRHRRR